MIAVKERSRAISRHIRPWMYIVLLFVNVSVFACIGTVYQRSATDYREKLFRENVNNVESLNAASANAAFTYTQSMGIKVDDTVSYIRAHQLGYDETVAFLRESNTSVERQFQLVLCGSYVGSKELSFGDYSGVSVRNVDYGGEKPASVTTAIAYSSGYYDILRCFTDVNDDNLHGLCFAPEFTDPDTKQKCFGVYRHVALEDAGGSKKLYAVLLAINSETALGAYNMQEEFDGQSTVLINEDGGYIIKNSDYRNANFYDYIVNYNDLPLDQRTRLHNQVLSDTSELAPTTSLFYKNHKGVDCVFSVTLMDNGWYSVTCVPISSFRMEKESVNYSLTILLLFILLFIVDGVAIYFVGTVMNHSVQVAKRAKAVADSANRAKSRFLSTMSHELRTPLNAIIGLTSLSGDSIDDPPVLKDYLKKIDISSKLLLQLISDILDVSAIESDKLKLNSATFDVTRLITALSVIYYEQCAAKGIEFSVVIRDMHSDLLIGDSVRVNQVLLNFLSNAVKYTPSGGKVTLCAGQLSRDGGKSVIRFEVRDTGCGISDDMKKRLFLPFERAEGDTAQKAGGTGLGLSIAKNLTVLMGGRIGVESREGEGALFWAEIPFAVPEEDTSRSFSPIKELTVLVADSNEDERVYIDRILTSFGMAHALADNAADALTLLLDASAAGNPYNLCILDWKLSDLTALDAAAKIRESFDRNALRIVTLAYSLAEAKPQCIQAGADYVFGKPVFPSPLYSFLEEIATGRPRVVPDTVERYDFHGRRILLVEDNRINLQIAQLLLKKTGLAVEIAEDGKLGSERFISSKPGYFDAILMDVQMPVMNGYASTKAIRASAHPQAKSIPIIAMTADAFSEDVEKAALAGMNEHLAKPVVPENLYAILQKYLGKADPTHTL